METVFNREFFGLGKSYFMGHIVEELTTSPGRKLFRGATEIGGEQVEFVAYPCLGHVKAESLYWFNKKQRGLYGDKALIVTPTRPTIERRVENDHFGNEVSIILLPCGRVYRMVHHTPSNAVVQRATIYARRFQSIRYRHVIPVDLEQHNGSSVQIAVYEAFYDTEDKLATQVQDDYSFPEFRFPEVRDFEGSLLQVLSLIKDNDDYWRVREAA